MEHATIKLGEYTIPLIGLPVSCVKETCDRCQKEFHIQEVELTEYGILCFDCKLLLNATVE